MRSAEEVINLFKLKFNNLKSGYSPGLNEYEISVYLTQAKKEIIDFYYKDILKGTIDSNERTKKMLSPLIKSAHIIPNISDSDKYKGYITYKVNLPSDVWRVIGENVYISSDSECVSSLDIEVKPLPFDLLIDTLKNPFRSPDTSKVLRLDEGNKHLLISKLKLSDYYVTYLEFPKPYIIVDLKQFSSDFNFGLEENLTIDGYTDITLNELNLYMDDLIIQRAVELAIMNYKENNLATNVQLENRAL